MTKRKSFTRVMAMMLIIFMVIGFIPAFTFSASADGPKKILSFTFAGTAYDIYAGQSGSGDGIAWTCTDEGKVDFTFTKVGSYQFAVTAGSIEFNSVKLVGGGAGGSSAGVNNSGSGGGGGQIYTNNELSGFNSKTTPVFTVVVGEGGAGGVASNPLFCVYANCTLGGSNDVPCADGSNGGITSVGDYQAAGGLANAGGARIEGNDADGNPGADATDTQAASGGSGADVVTFHETYAGNVRSSENDFSCFICGADETTIEGGAATLPYIPGITPLDNPFAAPHLTFGGAGGTGYLGNAGNGGNPTNNHCCSDGIGSLEAGSNNGADATGYGNGGGGGAYASGIYRSSANNGNHSHDAGKSSVVYGYVGNGGAGAPGIAYLSGTVEMVSIRVEKTSDDGILRGHIFKITNTDTKEEHLVITDDNGIAEKDGLSCGNYEVVEVQNDAYMPVGESYKLNITTSGVYRAPFKNTSKKVNIILTKTDSETGAYSQGNASLVGAEYTLYSYDGDMDNPQNAQAISTMSTNKDGECVWTGLTLARSYFIKETKAAPGYMLDTEIHFVEVDPSAIETETSTIEMFVTDEVMKGSITVTKADSVTGTPQGSATVAGAVFKVTNVSQHSIYYKGESIASGSFVASMTTNAQGIATLTDLPYGSYRIEENSAPEGYLINSDFVATVDSCPNTQVSGNVTVKDDIKRTYLTVNKEDINTGVIPQGDASFAGTQFEIYNASANAITINEAQKNTGDNVSYAMPTSMNDGSAVYAPNALICTVTTKGTSGACDPIELPYGQYRIHESVAPNGYLNDAADQTVALYEDGDIKEAVVTFKDTPKTSVLKVNKKDAETGANAQGDGTLSGMTFEIYNISANPVYYNGASVAVNGLIATITTDKNGNAVSAPLPYGKYRIVEVGAPDGYTIPIENYYEETANYDENGMVSDMNITLTDAINRGAIKVVKRDAETGSTVQGDANLSNTTFYIYNASAASIHISEEQRAIDTNIVYAYGPDYAPEALIAIVKTGESGEVVIPNLPYGKYRIVETEAPVGYDLTNGGSVFDEIISIYNAQHEVAVETEVICSDTVQRGHWVITKADDYANSAQGAATLKDAKFEVINKSENPVWFVGGVKGTDGTAATSVYAKDEKIQEINTDENGKITTGDLPYGTYLIREIAAPEGYLLGSGNAEEGSGFEVTVSNYEYGTIKNEQFVVAYDSVKRGDLKFDKNNQAKEILPYVVFKVTSETTGESHLIVTDNDGNLNTSSEKILHTANTNANDAALNADGSINEDILNPYAGVWFYGTTDNTGLIPDNNRGAMPYDKYTVEEIRCEANEGLELLKFSVTIAAGGMVIDEGTLIDKSPVEMHSTFRDANTHENFSVAYEKTKLVETLDLFNLVKNRNYKITLNVIDAATGEIAVDAATGKPLTVTKTFTAESENVKGFEITIEFDATNMKGKTLIATDVLTYTVRGKTYTAAVHNLDTMIGADLEAQTITFPTIATTLRDSNGQKETEAVKNATLVDEVAYFNLDPNKTYKLTGKLIDKNTGDVIKDANGKAYVKTVSFKPATADGFEKVIFDKVDLSQFAKEGITVVAFETLSFASPESVIYEHADINDAAQTVTIPGIYTTAKTEKGLKTILAAPTQSFTDTVTYSNLIPNTEYTIMANVVSKADGNSVITDAVSKTFRSSASGNGTVAVDIILDATKLAGTPVVVFEKLVREDIVRAAHEDINDEAQTIYIPSVSTAAKSENGMKELTIDENGNAVIVDVVTVDGLAIGQKYKIEGRLYNKAYNYFGSEYIKDANGQVLTETVEFVADSTTVTKELRFTIDASAFYEQNAESCALVAYERLYEVNSDVSILVGSHEDPNSEEQTVIIPDIRTNAHDEKVTQANVFLGQKSPKDQNGQNKDKGVHIVDTVYYSGLIKGNKYIVNGTLYDKATGEPALDDDGKPIVAKAEFVAPSDNGSVDVIFKFDGETLKGSELVAYEVLKKDNVTLVMHEDITDEAQTVYIPAIKSYAHSIANKTDKIIAVGGLQTVVDDFTYEGFPADKNYKLIGTIYDADTGEELRDPVTGKTVTAETFVISGNGDDWSLEYVFNTDGLDGKTLVCTTKVEDEYGRLVAYEKDLTDKRETVYLPRLATTASSKETDKNTNPRIINAGNETTFIDYIDYSNVIAKDKDNNTAVYTVVGTLYDKNNGTMIVAEGKPVTAISYINKSGLFTKPSTEGKVTMEFPKLDIKALAGHSIVVYERMYYGEYKTLEEIDEDKLIYRHENPNDEAQTLNIPSIATTLTSAAGMQIVTRSEALTDAVAYNNLTAGERYSLVTKLYDKTRGKLTDITVETLFVAESSNGVNEIKIDVSRLGNNLEEGHTYVCFEYLYLGERFNNNLIAEHADMDDEAQTVRVPKIGTTATSEDGEKVITIKSNDETVIIKDTVAIENISAVDLNGKAYRYELVAVPMNAKTNEPIKDIYGNTISVTSAFTVNADTENSYEMYIPVPATSVKGEKVVIYETLKCNGNIIAEHNDLTDLNQTVDVTNLGYIKKINGTTKEPLAGVKIEVKDITANTSPKSYVTDEHGEVFFEAINGHEYEYYEIETLADYTLDSTHHTLKFDKEGKQTGDELLINYRIGTVVITKTDSTSGEPLEGATIQILKDTGEKENGKPVYSVEFEQTTDRYGKIYFFPENPGSYVFRETVAPDGYYLETENFGFTVNADMTVSGITSFTNSKLGTIALKKYSESGERLEGAVFAVYNRASGQKIGVGRTNSFGRVYFVSPGAGSYYFVEEEAPHGYVRDTQPRYFNVAADGTITGTTSMTNKADPSPLTGDMMNRTAWLIASGIGAALTLGAVSLLLVQRHKARKA